MSDRIAVMYLGKIVELADSQAIYDEPLHPYTRTLLAAIPIPDPDRRLGDLSSLQRGDAEATAGAVEGCVFRSRCPLAASECEMEPTLREITPGHWAACHYAGPPAADDPRPTGEPIEAATR